MAESFQSAMRQAIYLLECPLQKIADDAESARTAIYAIIKGKKRKFREPTAKRLACAVCDQLQAQIDRRLREIDELKRREENVRIAFWNEYGGGKNGS